MVLGFEPLAISPRKNSTESSHGIHGKNFAHVVPRLPCIPWLSPWISDSSMCHSDRRRALLTPGLSCPRWPGKFNPASGQLSGKIRPWNPWYRRRRPQSPNALESAKSSFHCRANQRPLVCPLFSYASRAVRYVAGIAIPSTPFAAGKPWMPVPWLRKWWVTRSAM